MFPKREANIQIKCRKKSTKKAFVCKLFKMINRLCKKALLCCFQLAFLSLRCPFFGFCEGLKVGYQEKLLRVGEFSSGEM